VQSTNLKVIKKGQPMRGKKKRKKRGKVIKRKEGKGVFLLFIKKKERGTHFYYFLSIKEEDSPSLREERGKREERGIELIPEKKKGGRKTFRGGGKKGASLLCNEKRI